jgi:hypothetical protein
VQEYDVSLKVLLQSAAVTALRLLTGKEVVEWLNVELPKVQNRQVDLLGLATDGELVHIELQSTNDSQMPLRMAEYCLAIYRAQSKWARQLVLYVGREPLRMAAQLRGPQFFSEHALLDIRDVDSEPLISSPHVSDNVIAMLGRVPDAATAARRVLGRIATLEPDARMRYLRLLFVIGGLRGMEDLLEKEVSTMPVYIDILENKVLGREYKKGELAVLRKILEKRFGPIPQWVEERITAAHVTQIEAWGVALLDTTSLEELFKEPSL